MIDATIPTVAQLTEDVAGPERDLSIINNAALALSASTDSFGFGLLAATNVGTANVINNGSITVVNATGCYFPAQAIFGGSDVTNTGTIAVSGGGDAISGTRNVTNRGVIDVTGPYGAGVSNFTSLANSGAIRADGVAVAGGFGSSQRITNNGTIESRSDTAIRIGFNGSIVNAAVARSAA